jgi:hypothetical protein
LLVDVRKHYSQDTTAETSVRSAGKFPWATKKP